MAMFSIIKNKRINFLNEVIKELNLKNIETVHARAEEFGRNKKYRQKFDIATSRAVANLSTLSEYMIPLVKINGRCICMKGKEIKEELKDSLNAIKVLGGKVENVEEFELADNDINRSIIYILKEKYKRLIEIYKSDVPYLSLYNNKYTIAYSSELVGDLTPNWFYLFYGIEGWYK